MWCNRRLIVAAARGISGKLVLESGKNFWFDANTRALFTVPAPGSIGNTGRNFFLAPHYFQWDASLSKKFKVTERVTFDLRFDARNVLNHPSFDNPTAVINSAIFGRINDSVTNNARRIQVSGKVSFLTAAIAERLLLLNARMALPSPVVERGALLVEAGRIARIFEGSTANVGAGALEFELAGLTLFPGFIDVHIHGAVGADTMAASAEDLRRVSEFLSTQGVTGWLPTLVPASDESYAQAVQAIEQLMARQGAREQEGAVQPRSPQGARVLGLHYEGPFVNDAQCGALHTDFFRTYSAPEDVAALPIPNIDEGARMITVAPEIEGGIDLVRELTAKGWIVSLGHTRASVDALDQAFKAGARHMTHFMNAMPPLHHRSPGPIGWGLSRDDVTCDIIADGVHLDPLMLRLLLKIKSPDRLALISDAIAAAGLGDGDYQIWGETISVTDRRTQNERGSIAGSVITMLDAVRMMLTLGVDETEVARMAATNPARLLGIDTECGSIEAGKRADLVALDSNGNVKLTVVGGQVAFQS